MPENWRLTTKRARKESSITDSHLLVHSSSRHRDTGEEHIHPDGSRFGTGSLFPKHIKTGHLTEMERFAQEQYLLWKRNLDNAVLQIQEAGGGYRMKVKLSRFGIKVLGVFVREHSVASIFPDEAMHSSYLTHRGEKRTKSLRT